jgi:hypothetical protein
LFIPVADRLEPTGRVGVGELPAAEFAIAHYQGPLRDADRIDAVGRRGPLEHIVAAHEAVEQGTVPGNVVVDVAP